MTTLTIRNLSETTRRALKARARRNERSTEAEVRAILDEAVKAKRNQKGLGTVLREFGEEWGPIEFVRDKSLPRIVKFD